VAARGPISNTTTIVDRATDIAAPENMEAETLRATDRDPTPQEDEIGQRGEDTAPRNGGRVRTGTYNGHSGRTTTCGGEATDAQ